MTRTLLHVGGPFNARVFLVGDADGARWVEKDFSASPRLVRHTIGRFLIGRECRILRRLAKTGVVPGGVRRLSAFALREDFIEGETLRATRKAGIVPSRAFFEALDAVVRTVHRARFVHLDLHNARNVMVAPDGRPFLIDWQSALPTLLLPPPIRRALERIDLAGVYKAWEKSRPGELSPARRRLLSRSRRFRRRFWIPRIHKGAKER